MPHAPNSRLDTGAVSCWDGPPVAILWTHSLVWGLLCLDALSVLGIPFRLLSASDVCEGRLEAFRVLIVPGGWAAHKACALGDTGRARIARFIDEGGSYLGFCGGAGLALSSPPALNLVPIKRMPLSRRLPSASGRVYVCGMPSHSAWENIPDQIPVSIWWPSQFLVPTGCEALRLASYTRRQGEDFQVADLRVRDLGAAVGWAELERVYGINLDPARIYGEPAIIEVRRGKGALILSYAHLETPGDSWGNRLLVNILQYLDNTSPGPRGRAAAITFGKSKGGFFLNDLLAGGDPGENRTASLCGVFGAKRAARELIAFGQANLLWDWRKPWLLNWRRGIRGFEYGALFVCLACMAELERRSRQVGGGPVEGVERLEQMTLKFCGLARRLLFEEKLISETTTLSKIGKVNETVDSLRVTLFGEKMNHGGLCAALFDLIDRMLLALIREAMQEGTIA
ncbi:MAG: BPL-N domain-containing protein [Syntrophobacteraceae bacterium]|nr:BPL-N domain-containing protein [Syntrophobacteraceae bacterium]